MILLAGLSLVLSSCREEPEVVIKPVFPALVENYNVAPGATVTLNFEANMDWTVSVPTSGLKWFWIEDNSIHRDKVSGKVELEPGSCAFFLV